MDAPTAIFHEMCHHATLFDTSTHGAQISREVVSWIQQRAGGDFTSWPATVVPGSYARSSSSEYKAEFFSVLRVMDLGLNWDLLAENAASGQFAPPAELRAIAARFYDSAAATQGSS
jgi:hypothetical protein